MLSDVHMARRRCVQLRPSGRLAWGFPGHGAVRVVLVSPWSSGIYNSPRAAPVPSWCRAHDERSGAPSAKARRANSVRCYSRVRLLGFCNPRVSLSGCQVNRCAGMPCAAVVLRPGLRGHHRQGSNNQRKRFWRLSAVPGKEPRSEEPWQGALAKQPSARRLQKDVAASSRPVTRAGMVVPGCERAFGYVPFWYMPAGRTIEPKRYIVNGRNVPF